MNNRSDYAKIITITIAFLLAFLVLSVNALPLNASAPSSSVSLSPSVSQIIGPDNPLYKYMHHVNVTQYEWARNNYNQEGIRFSPMPTAPETDHLLWGKSYLRYAETWIQNYIAVNGVVIVQTDTTKSIYPGVTYALDQNTGEIVWSLPAAVAFEKIGGVLWGGSTAYDPNTGKQLYTLSTRPSTYDPVLKMAFGSGVGYNWPDLTKAPTVAWRRTGANATGYPTGVSGYDNGRIFSVDGLGMQMTCYDAKTGQILWDRVNPAAALSIGAVGYGKIYCGSYAGYYCFDQATGNEVWRFQCHESSNTALAYGMVYFYETRTYLFCLDANDGHVVWRYAPTRHVPHWCGCSSPGDCNHTMHHTGFYREAVAAGKVYATTNQKTTYASLLPPNYPGVEYEGVKYWVNPNPVAVVAHCGENEFVCLDAYTGKVDWRVGYGWPYGPNVGTAGAAAYAGPDMGYPVAADGKVYGVEEAYSGHTGIGTSRPELDPLLRYAESKPKLHLSNIWYSGRVYCFGPGPVELTVDTDKTSVASGQAVGITVAASDLSPAHPLSPAEDLPVTLRYIMSTGAQGTIASVTTDKNGVAFVNWTPSASGTVTIIASSFGSKSHEAPSDASTTIVVSGGITLSTIGTIAGIAAITVSATAITVPIRKRKQEGGEQLE